MTDDRTLTALDQRGRAAAAGVRTAVAERPVPVFDPDLVRIDVDARPDGDRGRRSRPLVGLLAAAAAVLVVVAAVVALTRGADDDGAPADGVTPGDVRPYVLSDPPDGYDVAAVVDGSDPGEDLDAVLPFGVVTVYGPDEKTPVVGAYRWPEDSGTPDDEDDDIEVTLEEMDEVEVAGRRAWEPSDEDELQGLGLVVEVDGSHVVLTGTSATPAQLRTVAASLTVDGDRAVVPDDALPDGWSRLGEVGYLDLMPGVGGLRGTSDGGVWWLVSYIRETEDTQDVVYVTATSGDPIRVRAAALATDDIEEVTVRGHEAVVATTTFVTAEPGYTSVTWEERPGEIVQVVASAAVDRDTLLALAEGVRVADADEVADLRRRSITPGEGDPGVTVVGRGTFGNGDEWALVHGQEGSDTLSLETTSSSSGGSGSSSGRGIDGIPGERDPIDGVGTGFYEDVAWGYGRLGDEVAEVEIRLDDGATVIEATVVEQGGIRAWVAELPPSAGEQRGDEPIGEIVAYAADGTELARQRL